jgi:uncharacterized protein (DUF1697 family)
MAKYIAFLRAINVGRGRTIKMNVLRQIFESLGLSNIATFIASGNVLFEARTKNAKALEKKIEKRLREELGDEVTAFLRTNTQVTKISNYKPFPQSKIKAASEFNIIFLADRPGEKSRQRVMELNTNTNKFMVHGREIYWLRRKEPGKSTFSTTPIDKALGRHFTIRSAKTIQKMAVRIAGTKHD